MVFSCEKIHLYFVILSLILPSGILYNNLLNLLESFLSIQLFNVCHYPSNYPFFPRAGIDDINFDILVFLQSGEKNLKTKFLEATLCVMLFKMRDKAAIIHLEVRTKFYIPKYDDFGQCKSLICEHLFSRSLCEIALNNGCSAFKKRWKTRKHTDSNLIAKSLY